MLRRFCRGRAALAELINPTILTFTTPRSSTCCPKRLKLSPYVLEQFLDKLTDEDGAAWLSRMDQDDQDALVRVLGHAHGLRGR